MSKKLTDIKNNSPIRKTDKKVCEFYIRSRGNMRMAIFMMKLHKKQCKKYTDQTKSTIIGENIYCDY